MPHSQNSTLLDICEKCGVITTHLFHYLIYIFLTSPYTTRTENESTRMSHTLSMVNPFLLSFPSVSGYIFILSRGYDLEYLKRAPSCKLGQSVTHNRAHGRSRGQSDVAPPRSGPASCLDFMSTKYSL